MVKPESEVPVETLAPDESDLKALSPREGGKYNPEAAQESTRSFLAKILVFLFAGTSVLTVLLSFIVDLENKDKLKDFSTIIITTQGTLVGTALGFYFGDRS